MGQNLAILIGNTSYAHQTDLPCCEADVEEMRKLLTATQKFSQIIPFIDKSIAEIETALIEIAKSEKSIDEVFFYFTGHGHSNDEDFFMCFSDFHDKSPNTTGFSRTQAYELIREFGADLSVIVLDACEAGRNLIKSDTPPIARPTKTSFSNFLQISSSLDDQVSRGGAVLSRFTDAFIEACLQKAEGVIRYTDIENAIRDAFLNNDHQTPHFIRQGTSLHSFCADAKYLAALRESYFAAPSPNVDVSHPTEDKTPYLMAKEAIEAIDEKVPTKEVAQKFVLDVIENIERNRQVFSELDDFFEFRTVEYDDFQLVQNKKAVVRLLNSRGGSDSFVECDIERKKKQKPYNFNALANIFPNEYDENYDLINHCELKSLHVCIYFEPKLMPLNRILCEVVILPRLTECLILTCNSIERRSGWGTFNEFEGQKKWEWSHHEWFEDPSKVATDYISDPFNYAEKYVLSFKSRED